MNNISVIIPTCNRPKFLLTLLNKLNNQTYDLFEVIIVNDGGDKVNINKDDYSFKITLIDSDKKYSGASSARNKGAKNTNNEILSFLDDDDWWDNQFLEKMHQSLIENKCEVVFSGFWNVLGKEKEVTKGKMLPDKINYSDFYIRNPGLTGSNFLITKELFEKVKFGKSFPTSNDQDFGLRLFKKQPNYFVLNERLVYKNEHEEDKLTTLNSRKVLGSLRFFNQYKDEMPRKVKNKKMGLMFYMLYKYNKLNKKKSTIFLIKAFCKSPIIIKTHLRSLI